MIKKFSAVTDHDDVRKKINKDYNIESIMALSRTS